MQGFGHLLIRKLVEIPQQDGDPELLRQRRHRSVAIKKTLDYFGRVDILVNNAGLCRYALVQDLKLDDWDEMFEVNLRGTFLCTNYLLPAMLERKRGHIVNIACQRTKRKPYAGM